MKNLEDNYRILFKDAPISIWKEDLSELKKYLESLKFKNEDLRKYFDENPSEIMKCAQLVNVIDVNKSLMDLIEEKTEFELIGPLLKHITIPAEKIPLKEAVIELSKGNLINLVEGYSLTKQGEKKYLQYLTYIPEIYSSSWSEAWVFVINLTKQKALELKLNQMVEKNEFLIDLLTHELRNYHAQSQGFIEILLKEKMRDNEEIFSFLKNAKKGLLKATKLLENVTILMKSQITKKYELEPIELKKTLLNVKSFIMSLYPDVKVFVSIEEIPDDLVILADSLLEYLFINLFTNAVKYNQNEIKQIKVTSSSDRDVCSIKIADNGRGIQPKMRNKIFTRYSKFQKEGKGSGLGMFIVKTLVDRYNGQISIDSFNPDDYSKGTIFNVILKREIN